MADRTYDINDLALTDRTSLAWARAYVRFATRDKPNQAGAWPEGSLTNEEIDAILGGFSDVDETSKGGDGSTYYFPHLAASELVKSNPETIVRFSVSGYSQERRKPSDIARGILSAGRFIDNDILTATSGRLGDVNELAIRL